jgi:hypothetical protein
MIIADNAYDLPSAVLIAPEHHKLRDTTLAGSQWAVFLGSQNTKIAYFDGAISVQRIAALRFILGLMLVHPADEHSFRDPEL